MGMAGIKQLPCPSKIASFSWKLNEEALLKVSFKNIDQFQKYKALKWKIIFWCHFPYEIVLFKWFLTFKALYLWNQSIFLNETFRRASPLRFPENEAILDEHGNCLMPATPIFQKHCLFKKCPKIWTPKNPPPPYFGGFWKGWGGGFVCISVVYIYAYI